MLWRTWLKRFSQLFTLPLRVFLKLKQNIAMLFIPVIIIINFFGKRKKSFCVAILLPHQQLDSLSARQLSAPSLLRLWATVWKDCGHLPKLQPSLCGSNPSTCILSLLQSIKSWNALRIFSWFKVFLPISHTHRILNSSCEIWVLHNYNQSSQKGWCSLTFLQAGVRVCLSSVRKTFSILVK